MLTNRVLSSEELFGWIVVLTFTVLVCIVVYHTRLPRTVKYLVFAALAARVLGSWLRYTVLFELYRGSGDARRYYSRGLDYAEQFWALDFSPFWDSTLWVKAQWWGTQFVSFPSGLILSAIGPSLLGEFLAFSLLAFLGMVGFGIAFHRAYPDVPVSNYLRWIWLFPSLWYWPSSVGKEAILIMGLGIAVAGFIGRGQRINWVLLLVGLFFVFAIRPQVAAVVILSLILAQWLSLGGGWTLGRSLQGAAILVVGLAGIWFSMQHIGVGGFDIEGVQDYLEDKAGAGGGGGSGIEEPGVGLAGVPVALANILFRPFPWEARSPIMLFSAVEILAFWTIVWFRRRDFMNALWNWRSDRFLRMALPFILVYCVTLGMIIANLGIIARQRVFLFPFLFLLIEAMPKREEQKKAPDSQVIRFPLGRNQQHLVAR